MELSPEERRKIYEEELVKMSDEKLQNLSPEERKEVYVEELEKENNNSFDFSSRDIVKPYSKTWLFYIIYFPIFMLIWYYYDFSFMAFIGGMIGATIITLIIFMAFFGFIRTVYYYHPFTCKHCNRLMYYHIKNQKELVTNWSNQFNCAICHSKISANYKYMGNTLKY